MIGQILPIFLDVIMPVFALVLIGYLVGPRLRLEASTLSRVSYYVFVPAFVFDIVSEAEVSLSAAARMVAYILVLYTVCALLGFGIAKALGRSRKMAAAYVLIAAFSNAGNFGLSLISFRLGEAALMPGTVYFLALVVVGFVIGVGAASWAEGAGLGAVASVLKTPALLALLPAAFFGITEIEIPLFLARTVGLLRDAMIPVMLVTLGVQLAEVDNVRFSGDVVAASAVRLVASPLLGALLVGPFGLSGLARSAGIIQASMPVAVLSSIIAIEYDVVPDFVTTSVLFSTLASLFTLTAVLLWV